MLCFCPGAQLKDSCFVLVTALARMEWTGDGWPIYTMFYKPSLIWYWLYMVPSVMVGFCSNCLLWSHSKPGFFFLFFFWVIILFDVICFWFYIYISAFSWCWCCQLFPEPLWMNSFCPLGHFICDIDGG